MGNIKKKRKNDLMQKDCKVGVLIEKKHKKSRALHGFFIVEPLVVGITCRFASLKAQQLAERNKSESRRRQRA